MGVIEPGARAAIEGTRSYRIGVIGTQATMGSHAYQKAIQKRKARARVWEQPCPLFVPLVEEGWMNHAVTKAVAKEYLTPLVNKGVDSLVLGCTHYPLLKGVIRTVVGSNIHLIDSAEATAQDVERVLRQQDLLNDGKSRGKVALFVTDRPRSFARLANQFLGGTSHPAQELSLDNF